MDVGTTVQLGGVLTNLGTLRWISGNNSFTLQGSGRVENAGLWEVYQDPSCPTCTSESWVQVPVNVPVGGRLLVSTNADLLLRTSTGVLTIAGELEIQSGARLRLESSSPAIDLTLLAGSVNTGPGTLRFDGANRLVLGGDTVLNIGLADFGSTSSIVTSNSLTIASTATVRFDHSSTINGPVVVNGTLTLNNAAATLRINATLTLNASGTINNSGTLSVAGFVDNGGTLNGNPPVLLSPNPAPLRIERISLTETNTGAVGPGDVSAAGTGRMVKLKWRAASGTRFIIEATSDLRTWVELPAVITESNPGSFEATLPAGPAGARFYRLRRF